MSSATSPTLILNKTQIANIIRRIAYQIYECNVREKEIVLAGIADGGFILAKRIKKEIEQISELNCLLCEVRLNKEKPLSQPVKTSLSEEGYKNKPVVLIDDVLNSGTTLMYGIKHFLNVPLKQFNTVVLVNRNHKKYPVKADFKGISLSTSLSETVKVHFDKEDRVELV